MVYVILLFLCLHNESSVLNTPFRNVLNRYTDLYIYTESLSLDYVQDLRIFAGWSTSFCGGLNNRPAVIGLKANTTTPSLLCASIWMTSLRDLHVQH